MMIALVGFLILCFGSLIWGHFHIKLIYPVCGISKSGSWSKKYKHYKNSFNFFQRCFLLFLLDRNNRHSKWFRIYFVLHYIEWILTICVVSKVCFDDYSFVRLLFCSFGLLTIITMSIALEIPHMDQR